MAHVATQISLSAPVLHMGHAAPLLGGAVQLSTIAVTCLAAKSGMGNVARRYLHETATGSNFSHHRDMLAITLYTWSLL